MLRSLWTPPARLGPGIEVAGKTLLEVAVVLLGASVGLPALRAAGPGLLAGVAAVVVLALAAGYGIGRALGLSHRLAVLIACGNAICGNTAIATVAPVVSADPRETATAIAFTALPGVGVVLVLPVVAPLLHLTPLPFGALAGLTVYAVPQVLAATAPVGGLAVPFGTLVKLLRVLMLGPVAIGLASLHRGGRQGVAARSPGMTVPWFIAGFLVLLGARAAGLLPLATLPPLATAADVLTLIAMAALGLVTDLRAVAAAGPRVAGCVLLALLALAGLALGLIRLLALV